MKIKEKDIKLLWSRSGNRCVKCKIELNQDSNSEKTSYIIGQQAHIIGQVQGSPRGESVLSQQERDSYHNLIILCPNCHVEIDKNSVDWPVEKLYILKSKHELWVKETLSETEDNYKLANQLAVTNLIDAAVELCKLESWESWSSFALAATPFWKEELIDNIRIFREKVIKAIWQKKLEELERAIKTFSILIKAAADMFMENARPHEDRFLPIKFYRERGWNENYDNDLKRYEDWIDDCHLLVIETSKALNWFADIVRKDVNPMFFIENGRFAVIEGSGSISSYMHVCEYDDEEKNGLPEKLVETLNAQLKNPFYK